MNTTILQSDFNAPIKTWLPVEEIEPGALTYSQNDQPFDRHTVRLFAEKVSATPDGCWVWTASIGTHGYGNFNITEHGEKKSIEAHIYATRLCLPYDQASLDRYHLCENKRCVNPSHLTLVTKSQHMRLTPRLVPGAYSKAKTHCLQGHEFNKANTYIDRRGSRHCRMCKLLRKRDYRHKANPMAQVRRSEEETESRGRGKYLSPKPSITIKSELHANKY